MHIDQYIKDIDLVLHENIELLSRADRGLLSQNMLGQMRNFLEYIFIKIKSPNEMNPPDRNSIPRGVSHNNAHGPKWLQNFHKCIQASSSHYTWHKEHSERLMLKYYGYLLRLRVFLKKEYNLEVLDNLNKFPLNQDRSLLSFYEAVAIEIEKKVDYKKDLSRFRYRVIKSKPFFVNDQIYYEISLVNIKSKNGKNDRVIAFTKCEILDNYAIKISLRNSSINVFNRTMPIQIIENWQVAIRPCELSSIGKIFDISYGNLPLNKENYCWMEFLTQNGMNLLDVLSLDDITYNQIKHDIFQKTGQKEKAISNLLDRCRPYIIAQRSASNILKYLLFLMDNDVIRKQLDYRKTCHLLNNLYLSYSCIPFDEMPFCTSLVGHNPSNADLLQCIDTDGQEHQFLARYIHNNIENKGILFTEESELECFANRDTLISTFNATLYDDENGRQTQQRRRIWKDRIFYTMRGYVEDSLYIMNRLVSFTGHGIDGYSYTYKDWIQDKSEKDVCSEKKAILSKLFENNKVALIYGPAGTGKTKMVEFISQLFSDCEKMYLAQTNPAVENLKRKVAVSNVTFSTITKYLYNGSINHYRVLFIDECSTVNNADMRAILARDNFDLLVLVGDIYQIQSIQFGNWFACAKLILPKNCWYELQTPYRTQNKGLLEVWTKVRDLEPEVLEYLNHYEYSAILDESIFNPIASNEIILCLNYDGLYGINNINRIMQSNNPGKAVRIGLRIFKEGDPILFNESERFTPVLYNNLKGRIEKIEFDKEKNAVWFTASVNRGINSLDAEMAGLEWISNDGEFPLVRFSVEVPDNDDEEYVDSKTIIPFQVAYAVSIHKAQGLEYDSVKVVVSSEVGEQITHNIFYTAITRARQNLKIYWTPETEKKVLENMTKRDFSRDAGLLKARMKKVN